MSTCLPPRAGQSTISAESLVDYIFKDRIEYQRLISGALIHDLHTPLSLVIGSLDQLVQKIQHLETNKIKELLTDISYDCNALKRHLGILAFINSDFENWPEKNVKLHDLVNEVLIFFAKTAFEKKLSIKNVIPKEFSIEIEPNRLKFILIALITNAVESFESNEQHSSKNILIHSQSKQGKDFILVSDTGSGILPQVQNQILKGNFFSTKSPQKASGLGLILCKKLAKEIGLSLTFLSEPNKGSSFILEILKQKTKDSSYTPSMSGSSS